MTDIEIAGSNLFMMCPRLNESALTDIPADYRVRPCRPDELELWKAIHFDNPEDAAEQNPYMTSYFENVYAPAGDEFFRRCLFLCGTDDVPVGTCFIWPAYGCISTVHWYKIRREYEGRGLGRALLSHVMRSVAPEDYPVFLHTHPACCRAIRLYTDFGFSLLTDPEIGFRANDLEKSLPYLRRMLPESVYRSLTFASATEKFLTAAKSTAFSQF